MRFFFALRQGWRGFRASFRYAWATHATPTLPRYRLLINGQSILTPEESWNARAYKRKLELALVTYAHGEGWVGDTLDRTW